MKRLVDVLIGITTFIGLLTLAVVVYLLFTT